MASEAIAEQNPNLGRRLWWLILGRLVVSLLLLAISFWTGTPSREVLWPKTVPFLFFVATLTAAYALAHRFTRTRIFQVRLQIAVDIFLVTWLVWNSYVINSPYTALYIVIIAIASLFLTPREVVITSVGCAVVFTASALAALSGFGNHPAGETLDAASLSRAIQAVGLFDVAFFVVGLLSARLAEHQSGSDVRLKAATQSLATLRALHERIVASIRSGVVTTDLEGRIYTFNVAAREITGYSEDAIRGQDASILFGEIKDHVADALRAAETGNASPRYETSCLTSEGMRLRLGYSISPLNSEAGETTGMVITFQDLTQVRSLEETSRRQDRLAAIGRMAASIAHEIRNPLAAMRGSIQMLRSEVESDSSQADLMEIILRESDRLNRIITDFLSYARPRSLVQARVDVGNLL